jgi:WD40 repeat protein
VFYDIYTDQLVDLQELDGSVGATRVAKKDKTILYNANYGKTIYDKQFGKIPEIKRQAKLKTFNRETKFIADSIMGSLWSPNEEWFFALKFLGKKGRIIKWERVLMNRDGKAIILPSEESTISQAAWSADGNYLAVPQINGKLTVFEIEWMDSIPQVKSSIRKSSFSSPIIFPPDGKYILYVKYYEDGHNIFGNDIMLTDNKLNFLEPLIKHNELIEIPVMWTNDQGLITQDGVTVKNSRIIYKYRIKYK